jgi:hypothetical protein
MGGSHDRILIERCQERNNQQGAGAAGRIKYKHGNIGTGDGCAFTESQTIRARNAQYGWFEATAPGEGVGGLLPNHE